MTVLHGAVTDLMAGILKTQSSGLTCALGVVTLSALCPGPPALRAPVRSRSAQPTPLLGPIRAGHGALAPGAPLLPLSVDCKAKAEMV